MGELLEPGVEVGVVVFFDSRDNKRYGFVRDTDGKELFFHYNDGRIAANYFEAGLGWEMPANRSSDTILDYPRTGDELFFMRKPGLKGPKASPWTSKESYLQAAETRWCPCGHHIDDHDDGRSCLRCKCPDFGTPTESWETFTEVSFTEGPCGHKGYE